MEDDAEQPQGGGDDAPRPELGEPGRYRGASPATAMERRVHPVAYRPALRRTVRR